MTFLNALLSFGAAAFTIPLIIHLLNRSKFLTVDWGAMQFLESSLKVNSRRIQWKQLLLLLIRCMIPILLALAMARPFISAWKDTGANSAMSLAIVLDDSLSMQRLGGRAANAEVKSPVRRFDHAITELRTILTQLPSSSEVSIVLAGEPVTMLQDHQPDELLARLEAMQKKPQSAGHLDLVDGVRAGVEWLNQSPHARRQLLLVSDFSAADWEKNERDSAREMSELLKSQEVPIGWNWMELPPITSSVTSKDVSILSLESLPNLIAPSGQANLSATLQNHSKEPAQVPVVLSLGMDEMERQSVQIAPESTSMVRFQWSPARAGDAELTVSLDFEDDSPADNSIVGVLRVREPKKVLLIDGDRRNEAMKSESDFVRLALTPISLLRGEPGDLFTTRVVDSNGWNEAQLKDFSAVVCCNVPQLDPNQRKLLREFVDRGGGLVFCLGDRVQINQWNEWESTQNGGLRIGKLSNRNEWIGKVEQTVTPLFGLSKASLDSLATAQFNHRYELELEDPSGAVGLAFDDGKPWLLATAIGRGRCVWMLSSCDDADSNLTSRPVFVPLIQRLLATCLQMENGWRVMNPGETWRESWPRPTDSSLQNISVNYPDEETEEFKIPAPSNAADAVGNFAMELRLPRSTGIARASLGSEKRSVAVQLSDVDRRRECKRETIPSDELQKMAASADAKTVQDAKQWLGLASDSWRGRELWTWFWIGLLVFFLSEMLLQQSMMPRTRTTSTTSTRSAASPRNDRGAA
jgi:hypothetical protein